MNARNVWWGFAAAVVLAALDLLGSYLAKEFSKIGLRPIEKNGYFQPFKIPSAVGTLTLVRPQGHQDVGAPQH